MSVWLLECDWADAHPPHTWAQPNNTSHPHVVACSGVRTDKATEAFARNDFPIHLAADIREVADDWGES